MDTKFGYIALLGRPNAGKSTLLNACVGQKIVGVSKRPQTTRNKILGLTVIDSAQLAFLDTPGIQKKTGRIKMNQVMNKLAWSVVEEADVVCYLADSTAEWRDEDCEFFKSILDTCKVPVIVLATKTDSAKKTIIEKGVESIKSGINMVLSRYEKTKKDEVLTLLYSDEPVLVSSKVKSSIEDLKSILLPLVPNGAWLFDKDELTDKPEKFLVSELIREQLFRKLGEELPYGCGVIIDQMREDSKLVSIESTIIVSRDSHKPMVIGKKGLFIKEIGIDARESLEKHFGKKVFLNLFVKVKRNWIDDQSLVENYQQIHSTDE